MSQSDGIHETIPANETASIENSGSAALSISLDCGNGCRVVLQLAPGQALELTTGELEASVALHDGDAKSLLIIKPETAS